MKPYTLKTKIFQSFFTLVIVLGICIFVLGFYVIKTGIIERAQKQVDHYLASARSVYDDQADAIRMAFELAYFKNSVTKIKDSLDLDYLYTVDVDKAAVHQSNIVRTAAKGKPAGGTRLIAEDELTGISSTLIAKTGIAIVSTPKAKPTTKEMLAGAMVIECAKPLMDENGDVTSVIYAGKIINRDFSMVDKIRDLVFDNEIYDDKPIGTVTIFQDDTRIATNVLDENGNRAIGTRVSEIVYNCVVSNGKPWFDRAFVVTDWYLTAYEPIKDIDGKIIGILYVGTLEKPFNDMIAKTLFLFFVIIVFAAALGAVVSYFLAATIASDVTKMLDATDKLRGGNLGFKTPTNGSVAELNKLAESFNEMSEKLNERDKSLMVINEKLADSNKSYVDLIGFVAHELKGLLSSTTMNSYALRDGYLGMINFKQQRAVNSITRNLDYLAVTVRKFLNLGSIEKGEMELNQTKFYIGKNVFDICLETFSNMISQKHIEVVNKIDPDLEIMADIDMMMIVANNLISNAIKYGIENGRIEIGSAVKNGIVRIEVYNDGRPIIEKAMHKLFKRFSRLDVPEKKNVKGTGLGLFITKQIIKAHGGTICCEAREKGNSFIIQIERGV